MKKVSLLLLFLLCIYPATAFPLSFERAEVDTYFTVEGGNLDYDGIGTNTLVLKDQNGKPDQLIMNFLPSFGVVNQSYDPYLMGSYTPTGAHYDVTDLGYVVGESINLGLLFSVAPYDPGATFLLNIIFNYENGETDHISIDGKTFNEGGWAGGSPTPGEKPFNFVGFSDGNPIQYGVGFSGLLQADMFAVFPQRITPTNAVPEPSTFILLGSGLAAIALFRRKTRH